MDTIRNDGRLLGVWCDEHRSRSVAALTSDLARLCDQHDLLRRDALPAVDRSLQAKLAIQIGSEGFVLLPNGKLSSLLPKSTPFEFVGIPPLTGTLTGGRYVATASAVTGSSGAMPRSVVGLFATVTDSEPIGVGAFLELPALESPRSSGAWNGTLLGLSRVAGGPPADLTVIDVASGGDLVTWRIVAPGEPSEIRVPDLRVAEGDLGLVRGPITVQVTAAAIDDFNYGSLRNRQLEPRGFRAYAQDAFFASY
jgi:hypothetical protein